MRIADRPPEWQPMGERWLMFIWAVSATNCGDGQPDDLTNADAETMQGLLMQRFLLTAIEVQGLFAEAVLFGVATFGDPQL